MQGKAPTRVTLQRYYRPEDISRDQAYRASFREVFSSAQEETLDVDDLIGRCTVVTAASACGGSWGSMSSGSSTATWWLRLPAPCMGFKCR